MLKAIYAQERRAAADEKAKVVVADPASEPDDQSRRMPTNAGLGLPIPILKK
ncbi:hypothetical protein [Bradyrhizobium sp. USDA 10063]